MQRRIKAVVAFFICICIIAGGLTTTSANSRDVYLFYNQLSQTSKNMYNALKLIKPDTTQVSAEIEPITVAESDTAGRQAAMTQIVKAMQAAIDALLRDYPEIYWLKLGENGTNCEIYYSKNSFTQKVTYKDVKINIVVDDQYANSLKAENERLWEAIRNFEVEGDSRYEKVKSIHDTLCENITYKITDYCYEAVGALNYNEAVCEGISEAFKLICNYNDIPCVTVSGTGITNGGAGGSGPHMWNYVQMEDGRWYAIDATWDLGRNHTVLYDYLLVGAQTESKYYDDTFAQAHLPSGDFSGARVKIFEYPPLSEHEYIEGLYPDQPTTQPTTTATPVPTTASAPTSTPTQIKTQPVTDGIFAPTKTAASNFTQDKTTIEENPQTIFLSAKVKGVKVKAGKKKVTVTWKKAKNAKKYVIKYSYKKNMKGAKTKTVKKLKVVLKKLKSGKKVYIQVQGVNGKLKGKFSKKVSKKVK